MKKITFILIAILSVTFVFAYDVQIDGICYNLDHKNLNELFEFNPTAENIAYWIAHKVSDIRTDAACYKVLVQESEGNIAIWER